MNGPLVTSVASRGGAVSARSDKPHGFVAAQSTAARPEFLSSRLLLSLWGALALLFCAGAAVQQISVPVIASDPALVVEDESGAVRPARSTSLVEVLFGS